MSSIILFDGPLTGGFQPTKGFAIVAREFSLQFTLTTNNGPTRVQYYLEFGEDPDPNGDWFREIAQEDLGGGVVLMPEVSRTFANNGDTQLIDGVYRLDAEFIRRAKLVRVQIAVLNGTASAKISAPFGQPIIR